MRHNLLLYLLILANIFGILYGLAIYSNQLSVTFLPLWIFIADCPFYVFLATFSLAGVARSKLYNFIAAVGLVKYGLWTEFVLLLHPSVYFSSSLEAQSIFLFIVHIGMITEFMLILPRKIPRRVFLIGLGWFLLNDFVDYILGFHPIIPEGQILLVGLVTVGLSIFASIFLYEGAGRVWRSHIVKRVKRAFSITRRKYRNI